MLAYSIVGECGAEANRAAFHRQACLRGGDARVHGWGRLRERLAEVLGFLRGGRGVCLRQVTDMTDTATSAHVATTSTALKTNRAPPSKNSAANPTTHTAKM